MSAVMNRLTRDNPHGARPADEQEPEEGYADWLAEEIEAGCAELDAGEGIPAKEVWKSLGLE